MENRYRIVMGGKTHEGTAKKICTQLRGTYEFEENAELPQYVEEFIRRYNVLILPKVWAHTYENFVKALALSPITDSYEELDY